VHAVSINVRGSLGSREAIDIFLQEVVSHWRCLDMLFCPELDFCCDDGVAYDLGQGWSRHYAGEGSRAFGLWMTPWLGQRSVQAVYQGRSVAVNLEGIGARVHQFTFFAFGSRFIGGRSS
jgi:hypothetical protein